MNCGHIIALMTGLLIIVSVSSVGFSFQWKIQNVCSSSIGVGLTTNRDDVIGGHFVDLVTIYSISFAYKD